MALENVLANRPAPSSLTGQKYPAYARHLVARKTAAKPFPWFCSDTSRLPPLALVSWQALLNTK
jgi:hypothetical protein